MIQIGVAYVLARLKCKPCIPFPKVFFIIEGTYLDTVTSLVKVAATFGCPVWD